MSKRDIYKECLEVINNRTPHENMLSIKFTNDECNHSDANIILVKLRDQGYYCTLSVVHFEEDVLKDNGFKATKEGCNMLNVLSFCFMSEERADFYRMIDG